MVPWWPPCHAEYLRRSTCRCKCSRTLSFIQSILIRWRTVRADATTSSGFLHRWQAPPRHLCRVLNSLHVLFIGLFHAIARNGLLILGKSHRGPQASSLDGFVNCLGGVLSSLAFRACFIANLFAHHERPCIHNKNYKIHWEFWWTRQFCWTTKCGRGWYKCKV